MAINQIYGPNYWAGVEIPASGKYQARTGTTTTAVAKVVTIVNQSGTEVGFPTLDNGVARTTNYSASGIAVPYASASADALSTSAGNTWSEPVRALQYKFNGTSWDRDRKPNAASRIPSAAASVNATSAKASAGDVHCISGFNAAASVRYLKFYAKATAPTVGTDTPVLTIALPVGAFNINLNGHYISTGIAYGMTTGAADADTGALTAADIVGLTITYA